MKKRKNMRFIPLGDNYYHPQFEDDDSGEEWRQSQEELYFIYDWFQSRIFTRIKSKLVLIYCEVIHSQSFYIILEVYLACWTIPRIGAAEGYKQFYLDRYKRP